MSANEKETIYTHEIKVGDKTNYGTVVEIKRGVLFNTFTFEDDNGKTHSRNWHMFASIDVER